MRNRRKKLVYTKRQVFLHRTVAFAALVVAAWMLSSVPGYWAALAAGISLTGSVLYNAAAWAAKYNPFLKSA